MAAGKQASDAMEAVSTIGCRPALFARYRDLTTLRYDFPVVLIEGAPAGGCVRPLSAVVEMLIGYLYGRRQSGLAAV